MSDERPVIGSIGGVGGIGTLGSIGAHHCCKCGKTLGIGDTFCCGCAGVLGVDDVCPPAPLKCNLCCFIQEGDPVTIGTSGGFTIAGTVAEVLNNGTVVRLLPGVQILTPGGTTIPSANGTTQPTFVCCTDIEFVVKEDLDL